MNTNDVFYSLVIFIGFASLFIMSIMETRRKRVRDNWSQMKCNPSVMLFANYYKEDVNTVQNFNECMSEMKTSSLFDVLGPVNDMFSSLSDFGGSMQSEISGIKSFLNNFVSIVNDTFSVFFIVMTNMTAGVYKILANMRDTTERTIAVNELLKVMIDQQRAYINAVLHYKNPSE
tara:strand:+ start:150 stop:674 length:525 start_codon:yes stop_codon:yes gene_type:complete